MTDLAAQIDSLREDQSNTMWAEAAMDVVDTLRAALALLGEA